MRTHGKSRTFFAIACLCVLAMTAFLGTSAPTVGAAETFPGQGFLPDNRAWEMVSPPDKNGGGVLTKSPRVHAAADGNGLAFASLVPFADAAGTSVEVEYVARRDAAAGGNGWRTHSVTPRQSTGTIAAGLVNSGYKGDFAADLSRAVYTAWRPLAGAPNTASVPNLYLREDLSTPGEGSYRLLTDSLETAPALPPEAIFSALSYLRPMAPTLADASANFEHVTFESKLGHTADVPMPGDFKAALSAPRKLYENAGGEVRHVGRVPVSGSFCNETPGSPCEAALSSQAGFGAANDLYTDETISRDGRRIFFQTPVGAFGGDLYMREDGTRTFQLNASEKATPDEPKPAELWDTSADGSRAFFTTEEQLVEGDDNTTSDLYMYNRTEPEGKRLTLVSASSVEEATVAYVIGASDDGRYVYFSSDSAPLVPGEPPIFVGGGLHVWHEGDLSYIGYSEAGRQLNTPKTEFIFPATIRRSRVSPDGRHLLFRALSDDGLEGRGGFAGYEHNATEQLYLYDAGSGQLRCASCHPAGTTATYDAVPFAFWGTGYGASGTSTHLSHALSDDGRYVFFSTVGALVREDSNGTWDAYVYDSESEETHLLSSGQDEEGSWFMDASNDGSDAFIVTAEPLSRWDVDDTYDIYDARVGGGLPEPKSAPPSCLGDACQPAPVELNDPTPASSSFKGAGNPASKGRCPKGKRRVKARNGKSRCVARKSRRKNRKANNERRAGR